MSESETNDELVDYDFAMPPPKHQTVMRVDHDEHGSVGLDRSTHELRATCRCGESEVFAIGDDASARAWWDEHHDRATAPPPAPAETPGETPDFASYGTWCPHGKHIYVPNRVDQEPSAFVEADPWPCDQCDQCEVARMFADDAAYEEAAMRELGFPL